jgi:uncharacterized protein YbjT (DUF2867 family)
VFPAYRERGETSTPAPAVVFQIAAKAAAAAGVHRIIYLGGLHPKDTPLSTHMRSREAVGEAFLAGPVDAVVFQAGVVIGSESASFEMVRHLADTLQLGP